MVSTSWTIPLLERVDKNMTLGSSGRDIVAQVISKLLAFLFLIAGLDGMFKTNIIGLLAKLPYVGFIFYDMRITSFILIVILLFMFRASFFPNFVSAVFKTSK